MQLELDLTSQQPAEQGFAVRIGSSSVQLKFVRNRRSRRYVLRLKSERVAQVTVPRGGSLVEARRFVLSHRHWLEKQLLQAAQSVARPAEWRVGSVILFRGQPVAVELLPDQPRHTVRLGTELLELADPSGDLRREITLHLWCLARSELPQRVEQLANHHQLTISAVKVRNQRSRWGSCSPRRVVSLNWRLIQVPEAVRDYVILHELAHLSHMNHSGRFWAEVERLCPDYLKAEAWLKAHSAVLK